MTITRDLTAVGLKLGQRMPETLSYDGRGWVFRHSVRCHRTGDLIGWKYRPQDVRSANCTDDLFVVNQSHFG